jgi:hypothetical protein
MMDIFRDPAEVAKEQAEIARLKKEGLELEQEKGLLDSHKQNKQKEKKAEGLIQRQVKVKQKNLIMKD